MVNKQWHYIGVCMCTMPTVGQAGNTIVTPTCSSVPSCIKMLLNVLYVCILFLLQWLLQLQNLIAVRWTEVRGTRKHCNTCQLSTPKNFWTVSTELAGPLSFRVVTFSSSSWCLYQTIWHRCYCRYNLILCIQTDIVNQGKIWTYSTYANESLFP